MEKSNELPVFPSPLAHLRIEGRESAFEAENQAAGTPLRTIADTRRQPRFKIEVDISVSSQTCGILKGYTVDINELGIAAMLRLEAPVSEVLELNFTLPYGPVKIHAVVRDKNAFRYGFEFFESGSAHEVIRRACRELAFSNP
jgi:hypothetical protein